MTDFKRGNAVVLSYGGSDYQGRVDLASADSCSLVLAFEAMIDGHAGAMAVLRGRDGVYRSISNGAQVDIRLATPAEPPLFRGEPGWAGMFTRAEHPDAYRNGTRVEKAIFETGDAHPIGSQATVLGSVGHAKVGMGYFVEWDARPRVAVFVEARKVRNLSTP